MLALPRTQEEKHMTLPSHVTIGGTGFTVRVQFWHFKSHGTLG